MNKKTDDCAAGKCRKCGSDTNFSYFVPPDLTREKVYSGKAAYCPDCAAELAVCQVCGKKLGSRYYDIAENAVVHKVSICRDCASTTGVPTSDFPVMMPEEVVAKLIDSLGASEDRDFREKVLAAMKTLTNKDFGYDIPKWKEWLRKTPRNGIFSSEPAALSDVLNDLFACGILNCSGE